MISLPASLTVLIPVRANAPDEFLSRLALRDQCNLDGVTTIMVDDGSPAAVSDALASFCTARGWVYVFEDSRDLPFSLSRARNLGVAAARTEWIFFDDADIVYSASFFKRLKVELEHLHRTPLNFVSVPVAYLTQEATAQVLACATLDETALTSAMMFENPMGSKENVLVESFAPASALLALRKDTIIAIGGFSTSFNGWGGEDRDLIFRLLAANPRFPRPDAFAHTTRTNLNALSEYSSWRAAYRLHGDFLARKGLYAFHCWHEDRGWKSERRKQSNLQLAADKARGYMQASAPPLDPAIAMHLRGGLLFNVFDPEHPRRQYLRRGLNQSVLAKWNKFKNDPKGFFYDSKFLPFRLFAAFFKSHW